MLEVAADAHLAHRDADAVEPRVVQLAARERLGQEMADRLGYSQLALRGTLGLLPPARGPRRRRSCMAPVAAEAAGPFGQSVRATSCTS